MPGMLISQYTNQQRDILRENSYHSDDINDVKRVKFNGISFDNQKFHGNFIECSFNSFVASNINFTRCDWKDCKLVDCIFIDCILSGSSIISNVFEHCKFINCIFDDTSISDCEIINSKFIGCDLSHIIMKTCWLDQNVLSSCRTSNKIVESSVLYDNKFENMEVEIEIIESNFGLHISNFSNCVFYKRGKKQNTYVSNECINDDNYLIQCNLVEKFRILNFRASSIEEESEILEEILDPHKWTRGGPVPSSFGSTLSYFSKYIIRLYADNKIPAYLILKFHGNNYNFMQNIISHDNLSSLFLIASGVNFVLAKEVENFLMIREKLCSEFSIRNVVNFGAIGPLDKSYYQAIIDDNFPCSALILSVKPRNSPVNLEVSFLDMASLAFMLTLFLACRTKFELNKISRQPEKEAGEKDTELPILHIKSGLSLPERTEYELTIRAILPKSLLLDLRISLGVGAFRKARALLVDIISENKSNSSREAPDKFHSDM